LTKKANGDVFVNQAQVVTPNIDGGNGIVHVLNAVVVPFETVVDVALDNGFTSLATAVVTAELLPALTNPLATLTVFAPTNDALLNLINEGHSKSTFVTGNTVVDAIQITSTRIIEGSLFVSSWLREIVESSSEPIILATQHRRENFGEPLVNVLRALNQLATEGARVLLPVHPNPNVKSSVKDILKNNGKIHLLPPLTYCDMVYLLSKSKLVITDSGGLQEEGPTLGIPVLVTRDKTERPEGVATGSVLLVGTSYSTIIACAREILFDDQAHHQMSTAKNPYGDGTSSRQIVEYLQKHLLS
jgi:UDP-N-acetylglucosamine 2-epimerase (non-hydrolysing)